MNVAIIGAGLIGRKRVQALPQGVKLTTICDVDTEKGLGFAKEFKCLYEPDWRKVVANKSIDAFIISVTNNWLAPIAQEAILSGKHVLVEKPGARNLTELQQIMKAYQKNPVVVMFGYNHRYHPAILKAKEIVDSKKFGPVLFIRAKYGHGGRLGYEKEWRFQKDISGGGELLDQGSHLIDLVNFFIGEMEEVEGYTGKLFWKSDLEDSAFFTMKNRNNQLAQLSVTCLEWKNIFLFEILLKTAKIQIDGLGKSYGMEKLTLYEKKPEIGPPDMQEFIFPGEDLSWNKENEIFFDRITSGKISDDKIKEAGYVLDIINKIYVK